jgi:hypothetical protein
MDPSAPRLAKMAASGVELAVAVLGFTYKTYWTSSEFAAILPRDVTTGTAKAVLRSGARVPLRGT